MAKLFALLFSLCLVGAAHAAEIADAPIPEPNYVGIILFLAIMFGSCIWFMWKVMRKKPEGDDEK